MGGSAGRTRIRPQRLGRLLNVPETLAISYGFVLTCGSEGDVGGSGTRARNERLVPRRRMVERLAAAGVKDARVLAALGAVLRHRLIPEALVDNAYAENAALPIGDGQTISAPAIVATMTAALELTGTEEVLEIGTGSGYQAAVLSQLAKEVYSIEILEELSLRAQNVLEETGRTNLRFRVGDGYRGWPEAAPFDAIVVTAAPPHVPKPLVEQLAVGGHMVIPVGTAYQELLVLEKTTDGVVERRSIPVRFVPMTGEAQQ